MTLKTFATWLQLCILYSPQNVNSICSKNTYWNYPAFCLPSLWNNQSFLSIICDNTCLLSDTVSPQQILVSKQKQSPYVTFFLRSCPISSEKTNHCLFSASIAVHLRLVFTTAHITLYWNWLLEYLSHAPLRKVASSQPRGQKSCHRVVCLASTILVNNWIWRIWQAFSNASSPSSPYYLISAFYQCFLQNKSLRTQPF